jgi:hypothetical protein
VERFALSILFFSTFFSFAQNKKDLKNDSSKYIYQTPYNPFGAYQTWSMKGSFLPYLLGNAGGISSVLGFEYGFLKRHSLSIEGIVDLSAGSHDMVTDTSGRYYDVGNYYSTAESAVLLSYRYYLNSSTSRIKKGLLWYISPFVRFGRIHSQKDPAFYNDFINQDQSQKSAGILFGGISVFKKPSRMGFDFNAGIFYKEKTINTRYLDNGLIKSNTDNPSNWGVRIGLYIDYWFFGRKK